ncbi:MAG: isochorismatase family protein [Verrucomicrobiae bacterium]|nr:isochorismatase family protein [Verrucomicrobiae bacterium]
MQIRHLSLLPALALLAPALPLGAAEPLALRLRAEKEVAPDTGRYHSLVSEAAWDPAKTAVVICDMWDDHYCRNAAARVAEMAPRMNEVIKKARSRGVLIIHCPSGCMDRYADSPQRQLARRAPPVETAIPLEKWCHLDEAHEAAMPVKTEQPCDDAGELRERVRFYTRQIETLEIAEGDAVTDSAEAFYLMKQRGIENVLIMGVHTNMCVLGRPFGIRQLTKQGLRVALVRDMTDTMYNPAEEPFVNHFTGNDLVFEHIERHWCPTTTSGDLLGDGVTFRFAADTRPHLVIVTSEDEYKTEETLPPFALAELGKRFKISTVFGDAADKNNLPGAEVVADADVLLLAVRRRNPPKAQLDLFRAHVAAGKPLVGIRTASHAFHQRDKAPPEGLDEWRDFDPAVLGGHYHDHYNAQIPTFARVAPGAQAHPILAGVPAAEFHTFGSLYKNTPLAPGTTLLMTGRAEGADAPEPVAWTHTGPGGGRVFYTSLGHPDDFGIPAFRTLLRNAIFWAAGLDIPDASSQPVASEKNEPPC